jgi:hypothetical protein
VKTLAHVCILTILAVALGAGAVRAGQEDITVPRPVCPPPITKSYYIQPGFCPQHLVVAVPRCVPAGDPGVPCGSYGVPPFYTAGRYLMVRQSAENHALIARYLTEMGAYVAPKGQR